MHCKGMYYKRGTGYNTRISASFIYVNESLQFLKNNLYLFIIYYPACLLYKTPLNTDHKERPQVQV